MPPHCDNQTDVLIIGAGPAGLMLAMWLARLNISTRIVDKRSTKIINGHADGMQCRTLEVLQSFDIGDTVVKEGNQMYEVCFWNPDPVSGALKRTGRIPDTIPGISRLHHTVLHQGRIEQLLLDNITSYSGGRVQVERGVQPDEINIDVNKIADHGQHAVTVVLKRYKGTETASAQSGALGNGLYRSNMFENDQALSMDTNVDAIELLKARYVVGCDGARSWTRKQLGYSLEGESANYYWGVVDGVPVTDFPDIRMKTTIHSASNGTILIIPREQQKVRLYIQLNDLPASQQIDRSAVTPDRILSAARNIIAPYSLDMPVIEWYTCYEVGQRLCKNFSAYDRVFIAGDACHTHSPKAGQGMNVSMMDTYNLGWKLAHVIKNIASSEILSTYKLERRQVAQELIEFDYKYSRLFSGTPRKDVSDDGISMEEFRETFEKGTRFAAGTGVDYADSLLTIKSPRGQTLASKQDLARGIPVGQRLKSQQVVCISDASAEHFGDRLVSDGRWRIIIFAGDIRDSAQRQRLDRLTEFLASDNGPVMKYTPKDADLDVRFEIFMIMSNPRKSVEPTDFPDILRPRKGQFGYRDYWKIWCDDDSYHRGHGHAYDAWGIDPNRGALIVLRPDQHVSFVTATEDFEGLNTFFDAFMILQRYE